MSTVRYGVLTEAGSVYRAGEAVLCNRKGRRGRYIGVEKDVFDLCCYAFVEDGFAADRWERTAA